MRTPATPIAGRRVLITGASRGIGNALARGFAEAGAEVALVARSAEPLAEVAAATGGRAYPADLAEPSSWGPLIDRVEADGPIDVLVNNAGIALVGHAFDADQDGVERLLAVNLHAPIHLTRAVLPRMAARGRGHVVSITSLAAVMSPPGLSYYAASKAGLAAFMGGLRHDLREHPIGLTTVFLGSVPTEMDDTARTYGPIRAAAEDSKGRDITPLPVVVAAVVDAVTSGRGEVRLPKMMAGMPALVEVPRAVTRLMFKRYPAGQPREVMSE